MPTEKERPQVSPSAAPSVIKNVPNDYPKCQNQCNAAGRGRTASGHQSEQIGMKRGRHRPSGHAALFE